MMKSRNAGEVPGLFAVLLPTLGCNLACGYCFQHRGARRWDRATTSHVLAQVFSLASELEVGHLRLHWQGGEPLTMGHEFWQFALEQAWTMAGAHHELGFAQSMQTNLTLYHPSLAPLVHRYLGGRLGTSFDDERDGRRTIEEGGGDLGFCERWTTALNSAQRDGIEVGVLTLIGPQALAMGADTYLTRLRDCYGIRRLRLSLAFSAPDGSARGYWTGPREAGTFLSSAYRWWVAQGRDEGVIIRPFAFLEDRISGRDPREPGLCIFAQNCADGAMAVGPDGEVFLCDSCLDYPPLGFGNLLTRSLSDIFAGARRAAVRRECAALPHPSCLSCRYLGLCFGGCRVRSHPDADGRLLFHYCESYQLLFHTIEQSLSGASSAEPRFDDAPAV